MPEPEERRYKTKILVIEDDKFLRSLLVQKFSDEGYEVSEALDGEAGLSKARSEAPSLIILDLLLPKLDGFEVLAKLKEDSKTKAIPVLVLSNLGERYDIERARELGAEFMVKANFAIEEVFEKAKEILMKRYL